MPSHNLTSLRRAAFVCDYINMGLKFFKMELVWTISWSISCSVHLSPSYITFYFSSANVCTSQQNIQVQDKLEKSEKGAEVRTLFSSQRIYFYLGNVSIHRVFLRHTVFYTVHVYIN